MIKTSQPALHGVQHLQDGSDPIPGIGPPLSGDTLDSAILGLDPAGFWKLNEDTGIVAADSSGNSLDLATTGSYVAPIWGQPAGPPGEQAADFENGTGGLGGTGARVSRTWAPLTGSFTVGLFYQRNSVSYTNLIGQGNPIRAGGLGWELGNQDSGVSEPAKNRPFFLMKGCSTVYAVSQLLADTWVFVAGVHDDTANEARLYVNGVLQATVSAASYTPVSSYDLWIGHDGSGADAVQLPRFVGSYAFLYPVALTGAQLLDIYEHAGSSGFLEEGLVLTSNGFGASSWQEPTIRVSY